MGLKCVFFINLQKNKMLQIFMSCENNRKLGWKRIDLENPLNFGKISFIQTRKIKLTNPPLRLFNLNHKSSHIGKKKVIGFSLEPNGRNMGMGLISIYSQGAASGRSYF